jgi:beta-lactam-binding protein with PASTA domain
MADVYRARDELLGREVAVKVLSERFSRDRSFVERFRREAQAAANLSHPNIVSLYDYGSDDDTYFIVMEFIDGRSLAEIITADGGLQPERAAEIASDVAKALEAAHKGGLVHRDIKPGNIMITNSGQTKVTDFGIVRALGGDSEQTMTQTGMVIGTAAYLSPEQAQGSPVDARSDVYSLGCVLYEMLTGRAPFAGETPLSIAYKHVREEAEPPSRENSDVSPGLDAITLKALAKNPDNRYSSAGEMSQDLQRFLSGQNVQATPLMDQSTRVQTAVSSGTRTMQQVEYEDEPPPRRAGFYVLVALLILGLFALAAWFLATQVLDQGRPVTVPDVVGMQEEEARRVLERENLEVEVETEENRAREGKVIDQDPKEGVEAREGDSVTIVVSEGPPPVEVPDVVGLTVEEAEADLADARLRSEIQRETSEDVPEGEVMEQDPAAGEEAEVRSVVVLTVSSGPEAVVVPDVIGQPEEDAVATVQDAGLRVAITREPSDEFEEGLVAATDPAPGAEVDAGSTVTILVSEGPEEREMPDMTGQDGNQAEETLEADYGLEVTQQEASPAQCGAAPPGTVCDQDPAPGTPVSPGDSATLFVQGGGADLPGDGGALTFAGLLALAGAAARRRRR